MGMVKKRFRHTIDLRTQRRLDALINYSPNPEWKVLTIPQKIVFILDSVLSPDNDLDDDAETYDSLEELIGVHWDAIVAEKVLPKRLTEIQQGSVPCDLEIARIALGAGQTVEQVEELVSKLNPQPKPRRKKNGVS